MEQQINPMKVKPKIIACLGVLRNGCLLSAVLMLYAVSCERNSAVSKQGNLMHSEEMTRPSFVINTNPDSTTLTPLIISIDHKKLIYNFLTMLKQPVFTLEDYYAYFGKESEYEEIYFFSACCGTTRYPYPDICSQAYKNRIQKPGAYTSFFFSIVREKVLAILSYQDVREIDIQFVNASYDTGSDTPKLSSCTYQLKDKSGNRVFILLNAYEGEPLVIHRIGDMNGKSILEKS